MKKRDRSLLVVLSAIVTGLLFNGQAVAEGNRYDLERQYTADVSASATYLALFHEGMKTEFAGGPEPVLIDVRDINEYSAGHVRDAYSIPFPHILGRPGRTGYQAQDPAVFVATVMATIPDKDTPIFTMCRTGYRSVLAANLLAAAGYTRVMNVWEGFVGSVKTDTTGNILDLNNDGVMSAADLDGWSNFAGLPVSKTLEDDRLFAPYAAYYGN